MLSAILFCTSFAATTKPVAHDSSVEEVVSLLENRLERELDHLARFVAVSESDRSQLCAAMAAELRTEATRLKKIAPPQLGELGPASVPMPRTLTMRFTEKLTSKLGSDVIKPFLSDLKTRVAFENELILQGMLVSIDDVCFLTAKETNEVRSILTKLIETGGLVPASVLSISDGLPEPAEQRLKQILGTDRFVCWQTEGTGVFREAQPVTRLNAPEPSLSKVAAWRLHLISAELQLSELQQRRAQIANKGSIRKALNGASETRAGDFSSLVTKSLQHWQNLMATSLTKVQTARLHKLVQIRKATRREYHARCLVWILQFRRGATLRLSGAQQLALQSALEHVLDGYSGEEFVEQIAAVTDAAYIKTIGKLNFEKLRPLLKQIRNAKQAQR